MVQRLWKTAWMFLKKLNIDVPYGPLIPLLSQYPKVLKTGIYIISNSYLYMPVHSIITHNCQKMETTQVSFDG